MRVGVEVPFSENVYGVEAASDSPRESSADRSDSSDSWVRKVVSGLEKNVAGDMPRILGEF